MISELSSISSVPTKNDLVNAWMNVSRDAIVNRSPPSPRFVGPEFCNDDSSMHLLASVAHSEDFHQTNPGTSKDFHQENPGTTRISYPSTYHYKNKIVDICRKSTNSFVRESSFYQGNMLLSKYASNSTICSYLRNESPPPLIRYGNNTHCRVPFGTTHSLMSFRDKHGLENSLNESREFLQKNKSSYISALVTSLRNKRPLDGDSFEQESKRRKSEDSEDDKTVACQVHGVLSLSGSREPK